jgi:microcystin-dependent protein
MLSDIGEKVLVTVISAVISAVILSVLVLFWRLLSDGGLITALGGVSRSEMANHVEKHSASFPLPSGMVAAFDIREGCPKGWSEFSAAEKRTIIGASFSESGGKDNPYGFGATEGEEDILLTEDHIPQHVHEYKDVYYAELDDMRPNSGTEAVEIPQRKGLNGPSDNDNVGWALPSETGPFGRKEDEQLKHTNMQPYIALYFCKRD